MKNLGLGLLLVAAAWVGGGCASGPVVRDEPVTLQNYDAAWDSALEVLREEYYFRINREDRRTGYVSTMPEVGKSWFEFWRKDGATRRDTLESSIQTIFRTAIVTFVPLENPNEFRINVEVKVARQDLPALQLTDTSEAYEMFELSTEKRSDFLMNYGLPPGEEQEDLKLQKKLPPPLPVDLGDDEALATKIKFDILKRLDRKLAKSPTPTTIPVGEPVHAE